MEFKFDSFAAFMTMDGHGVFVWSVYALTLVVLVSLLVAPLNRKRRLIQEQRMILRRMESKGDKTVQGL